MSHDALKKYEYYRNDNGVLYCGSNLNIAPYLNKFDVLLTDPPYGIGESNKKNLSRQRGGRVNDYGSFDWDKEPASKEEIEIGLIKSERAIIWGGNYFDLPPSRGWLVWDKINSGDFADAELAWTNLKMSVRIFRLMWNGMIREVERDFKRVHPTQKPIALFLWCLGFVKDAKTVLDTFAGSCTTAIACERLCKKWICIEREERWCEVGVKRIEKERQQLKLW